MRRASRSPRQWAGIFYFVAASRELEGFIDTFSSKLQLSADGAVLASLASPADADPGPDSHYIGSVIVNANGQVTGSVTLPNWKTVSRIQTVAPDRVYSPQLNVIVSLTDGETLWSSPTVTNEQGGVTATHVIFGSRGSVRAEPF